MNVEYNALEGMIRNSREKGNHALLNSLEYFGNLQRL